MGGYSTYIIVSNNHNYRNRILRIVYKFLHLFIMVNSLILASLMIFCRRECVQNVNPGKYNCSSKFNGVHFF